MLGIYCRTSVEKSVSGVATIIQQEELGVNFANANNWTYKLYKDEGKSGYKYSDEDNPFKDRPGFIDLISDIKEGIISDVWVIENSRLSRNSTTQAIIYRLFEKHNVTIYENGRRYDLNNPTDKLTKQILDAVAEFERYEIVFRTSRGTQNAINNGKIRYGRFIGYDMIDGKTVPNHEMLENVKQVFDLYLNKNASAIEIAKTCFPLKDGESATSVATNVRRIINHNEYTGQSLTVQGRKIKNDFIKGVTPNLQELHKDEYWVDSQFYKESIITRDEWIRAVEKLEANRRIIAERREENSKLRETDRSLSSGLLQCGYCRQLFYYHLKVRDTKAVSRYIHFATVKKCKQNPKTLSTLTVDTIMDIWSFFNLLLDDEPMVVNQIIENLKIEIIQQELQIKETTKLLKKAVNVKSRFEENLLDEEDKAAQKVIINSITKKEDEIEKLDSRLSEEQLTLEEMTTRLKKLSSIDNNIETLQKYFSFRNEADYREARAMFRSFLNPYNDETAPFKPTLFKNEIYFYKFNFDINSNYKIVYSFIEEFLGLRLSYVKYNEVELDWIMKNQEKIKKFGILAREYIANRSEEKANKLLELCFNVQKEENSRLLTTDSLFKYYSVKEVAEKTDCKESRIRDWGRKHGVITSAPEDSAQKYQFWTEENLQEFMEHLGK